MKGRLRRVQKGTFLLISLVIVVVAAFAAPAQAANPIGSPDDAMASRKVGLGLACTYGSQQQHLFGPLHDEDIALLIGVLKETKGTAAGAAHKWGRKLVEAPTRAAQLAVIGDFFRDCSRRHYL